MPIMPRSPSPPPGAAAAETTPSPKSPTRSSPVSLRQPAAQKKHAFKSSKLFRRVKSVFKSFPIMSTPCKMPPVPTGRTQDAHIVHGGKQMTGTLFGHRKARVNLAIQENSKCLPMLVLEMSIQTGKLLHDMGIRMVRIAMECEKKPSGADKVKLLEEPIWSMYCNGLKVGYGVKREATEDDLKVMEMLHAVSMGAGVLPSGDVTINGGGGGGGEGELTYMRAAFERVVGSKDSETYYMMSPDGNSGPELTIFFIRI